MFRWAGPGAASRNESERKRKNSGRRQFIAAFIVVACVPAVLFSFKRPLHEELIKNTQV